MKIITPNSVTLFIGLKPLIVPEQHMHFDKIRELALEDKLEEAIALADQTQAITKSLEGTALTVEDEIIFYGDIQIEGLLETRLIEFLKAGIDVMPLSNFIERLYKNPSYRAVTELFGFLESSNLPITEDGYFVAYKKISHDYKDLFTGDFDNSVGSKVSMPRNRVNEDKSQTCSSGLHFAAYEYASGFGRGPLMAIKIDPADVVAIPTDYNNQKGRCCAYEVIEEVEGATLEEDLVYLEGLTEEEVSDYEEPTCLEDYEEHCYTPSIGVDDEEEEDDGYSSGDYDSTPPF